MNVYVIVTLSETSGVIVYLRQVEMSLSWLGLDGGGGGLGVGGEEDWNRSGGVVPVEHVRVQVPRFYINCWQIVPITRVI
jgi:hypothetical protein